MGIKNKQHMCYVEFYRIQKHRCLQTAQQWSEKCVCVYYAHTPMDQILISNERRSSDK